MRRSAAISRSSSAIATPRTGPRPRPRRAKPWQKFPTDTGLQMALAGQEADNGQADAALARVKAMLKGNTTE